MEEFARMGLEHQRGGTRAKRCRDFTRALDQRLVAPMHAVEIADRHRRPTRAGRHVIIALEHVH